MAPAGNISGELTFRPAEKPAGNANGNSNLVATVSEHRIGDSVAIAAEEAVKIPAVSKTERKQDETGIAVRPTVGRIPKAERDWAIRLVDAKSLFIKTVFEDGKGTKITTTRDGTTIEVDLVRQEEAAQEEREEAQARLRAPDRA
jgi:hypothetical protein